MKDFLNLPLFAATHNTKAEMIKAKLVIAQKVMVFLHGE